MIQLSEVTRLNESDSCGNRVLQVHVQEGVLPLLAVILVHLSAHPGIATGAFGKELDLQAKSSKPIKTDALGTILQWHCLSSSNGILACEYARMIDS